MLLKFLPIAFFGTDQRANGKAISSLTDIKTQKVKPTRRNHVSTTLALGHHISPLAQKSAIQTVAHSDRP
jgi:hypothetical protein